MRTDSVAAGWQEKQMDRRFHRRIQLEDGGQVIVHSGEVQALSVADICLGGIAFSYTGGKAWPDRELTLDFIDGYLRLEKVRVKVVWDTEDVNHKHGASDSPLRRCGIKFVNLNQEQEKMLRGHIARVITEMD